MINRLEALVEMAPIDKRARIHMLGDFIQGREKIIEDPFYVSLTFSLIRALFNAPSSTRI
jgi:hypothetical protein